MADISGNLKDWSTTAASNLPSGTTSIGTGLDDNLRELQKVVRQDLAHKGADIASAATTDIGAVAGLMHDITGTTTITSLGTVAAGIWKILKFEGALTLTHNASSLILPGGANITTADGDVGIFFSEGSGNWRCLSYMRATGRNEVGITLGTSTATTSGTAVEFTNIPPGVRRITVSFVGISTNGSSSWGVQLGDSGGFETSGYSGSSSTTNHSSSFTTATGGATNVVHGGMILTLVNASTNTWAAIGVIGLSDAAQAWAVGGTKSLSAELDRIRIATGNGSDTFDAGSINIAYE